MRSVWALPDAEATERLGALIGRHCPWGTRSARCVYLSGELGAGKTTLAAALLAAAGVQESVRSPSYALIEVYPLPAGQAVHVDLYRLRSAEELETLGLRDYLQSHTLLVLEWPERGAPLLPQADLLVTLTVIQEGRTAHVEAFSETGQAWLALLERDLPPSHAV